MMEYKPDSPESGAEDFWPVWHKGAELRSAQLVALERYLSVRSHILDEGAFGVDRMLDWRKCIRVEWVNDRTLRTCLSGIRGIASTGEPVWIGEDTPLERYWVAEGDDLPEGQESAGVLPFTRGASARIDFWVRVNSRDGNQPKLMIDCTPDAGEVHESEVRGALYLGGYEIGRNDGEFRLYRHPMVRRLCAFGPVIEPEWKHWVSAFRERLESHFTASARTGRGAVAGTLASELTRLKYEWPFLSVTSLARRLRLVSWLLSNANGPVADSDFSEHVDVLNFRKLTGDRLPDHLADMLPEQAVQPSSGLAGILPALIEQLTKAPIDFYAPLSLLRAWSEALDSVRKGGVSDEDNRSAEDARHRADNSWTRAVVAITAMHINNPPEVSDATAAAKAVDVLYGQMKGPANNWPAGPLGFYCLARAALLFDDFSRRCPPSIKPYFDRLNKGGGSGSKSEDRMLRFIEERVLKGDRTAVAVKPVSWWKGASKKRPMAKTISVAVIGPARSGKTALIRGLLGMTGPVPSMTSGVATITGRMTTDNETCEASITEIEISNELFDRWDDSSGVSVVQDRLRAVDWVVLTIPPDRMDLGGSAVLREIIGWKTKEAPRSLVSIAYTKADEYGVVESDRLRIVENPVEKLNIQAVRSAGNRESHWEHFLNSLSERVSSEVKAGDLVVPSKKTGGGESAATRKHVLKSSETLWMELLLPSSGFINGYFVAAASEDPYLEKGSRTGVPQLVADFFESFKMSSE